MTSASVWDIKRHVEESNPDFPHIDILAPDFDLYEYNKRVQTLLGEAGIPTEPYSITWEDLKCTVPVEPPQLAIATLMSGFKAVGASLSKMFASLSSSREAPEPVLPASVLDQVSGYLKPRQLCLLLGQSGSGTSLLLSRIAGREMPKLIETSGSVLYQGEERLGGIARPEHIVHYIGQKDIHYPELTVRHTLEFAAACKWPSWAPYSEVLRRNDIVLTARFLGIETTMETIVGSTVLRGVSGGERKRVTIGEMTIGLVSGALVMDNWSKGLDSATTLSITQSMRDFVDTSNGSVIVSMQAPGTEVFNFFDTVCLLHKGRLLYFGPASKAETYFNGLGFYRPIHRTTSDFISTIMDPIFRHDYVRPVESGEPLPPETADEFAECFERSSYATEMRRVIDEIKSQPKFTMPRGSELVANRVKKPTLQRPRFQLLALMRRQKNYVLSTRKTILQDVMQNLIFGILIGTMFWQLPDTRGGADSRAGGAFLGLMFIALGSLAKVNDRFAEKLIFAKQRDAAFFDSWTFLLTQAVFDFVLELVKSAALYIPLTIMAGFAVDTGGSRLIFAVFCATMMSVVLLSETRVFAAAFDDAAAAQGVVGVVTIVLILLSGYLKSGDDLDGYLKWIYWINPFHYAQDAILINEFANRKFGCAENELLPVGIDLIDRDYQNIKVCLAPGNFDTGENYLKNIRGIDLGNKYRWYYLLVLVAYYLFFFFLSAITTAASKPKGHPQKKSLDETEHLNDNVTIDVSEQRSGQDNITFTFTNIKYAVEGGSKVLLPGITGNTVGGKVTLLIGTSGAGKTTLLDVCAYRKTLGKGTSMSGEIRLNGQVVDGPTLARYAGYCEQNDMHAGGATVYEAVLFAAKLRLPTTKPIHEKEQRTMETLEMLGLDKYADRLVKNLGSGELKLLTMALEVVTDPKVLFLDEPTSGISSSGAITVAKALRKIADSGTAVVCTLHQPSAEVFGMFDRVLLLKRGGKVVYFGDIGENSAVLRDYFESRGGHRMNVEENPAAWMLEVVDTEGIDWPELWNASEEKVERERETRELAESNGARISMQDSERLKVPPLSTQAYEVIRRQFQLYWRNPEYNGTRITVSIVIGLVLGVLYLQDIGTDQSGFGLAFAALFLTLVPASISAQNIIPLCMEGRDVFYREVASGTYAPLAYHSAVGFVEVPYTIFNTAIFATIFYFMVGLDSSKFYFFLIAIELIYVLSVMYGIMLASIMPTVLLAATVENGLFSLLLVLSGFFIRKTEMRPWWKWTTWLNPFSYYLGALIVNQFDGKVFSCEENERIRIMRPPDIPDCANSFATWMRTEGEFCSFCPTPDGVSVIKQYGADDVDKWVALIAISACMVFFRLVAAYGFTKKRFLQR